MEPDFPKVETMSRNSAGDTRGGGQAPEVRVISCPN
jgi:hypothetical protein